MPLELMNSQPQICLLDVHGVIHDQRAKEDGQMLTIADTGEFVISTASAIIALFFNAKSRGSLSKLCIFVISFRQSPVSPSPSPD